MHTLRIAFEARRVEADCLPNPFPACSPIPSRRLSEKAWGSITSVHILVALAAEGENLKHHLYRGADHMPNSNLTSLCWCEKIILFRTKRPNTSEVKFHRNNRDTLTATKSQFFSCKSTVNSNGSAEFRQWRRSFTKIITCGIVLFSFDIHCDLRIQIPVKPHTSVCLRSFTWSYFENQCTYLHLTRRWLRESSNALEIHLPASPAHNDHDNANAQWKGNSGQLPPWWGGLVEN